MPKPKPKPDVVQWVCWHPKSWRSYCGDTSEAAIGELCVRERIPNGMEAEHLGWRCSQVTSPPHWRDDR